MIQNDIVYSGSAWFNGEKVDEKITAAIVYDWFSRIKNISDDERKNYQFFLQKRIYGEFTAPDGDIDAVKVALLFCIDVIFYDDDEVNYDGYHQHLTGLELNATKIYEYPTILSHSQAFGNGFRVQLILLKPMNN